MRYRSIAPSKAGGNAAAGTIVCCSAKGLTLPSRTSSARASVSTRLKAGETAVECAGKDVVTWEVIVSTQIEDDGVSATFPLTVLAALMAVMSVIACDGVLPRRVISK